MIPYLLIIKHILHPNRASISSVIIFCQYILLYSHDCTIRLLIVAVLGMIVSIKRLIGQLNGIRSVLAVQESVHLSSTSRTEPHTFYSFHPQNERRMHHGDGSIMIMTCIITITGTKIDERTCHFINFHSIHMWKQTK